MTESARLWRVFPYDPNAARGKPFSPEFVPLSQGQGRFDLAGERVLYLGQSPAHAIAEKLQVYRGQILTEAELRESRHALALAPVTLRASLIDRVADLCDPTVLSQLAIRPDELAARNRDTTQAIAARLYEQGRAGLRWWSSLMGEWHTTVLFLGRVRQGEVEYGVPEPLALSDPALRTTASLVGIRLATP